MANAWHLRNDGKAFPVKIHMYAMRDENLASEAEVAAFIISTNSADREIAEFTLDAYMMLLLESEKTSVLRNESTIEAAIVKKLSNLPYKFAYPLTIDQMLEIHKRLHNFYDINSASEFLESIRKNIFTIWRDIRQSFNQTFIRVRMGGEYQTVMGDTCAWFRIASVGYNWDNVIYVFAAHLRRSRGASHITICRDAESDGTEDEFFYKARDGFPYHMMPIDEFLSEEHEKNPVFSNTEVGSGVIHTIRKTLRNGHTFKDAYDILATRGIVCTKDYHSYLLKDELEKYCISASEWFDSAPTQSKRKLGKFKSLIMRRYPHILDMEFDCRPHENRNGKMTGFALLCTLVSDEPDVNGLVIEVMHTKPLNTVTAENLAKLFSIEITDYQKYHPTKVILPEYHLIVG